MLRGGINREVIVEDLRLTEYQFRGFKAAYSRGAYDTLLMPQKPSTPEFRVYVDSHGVVHRIPTSQHKPGIEGGYK